MEREKTQSSASDPADWVEHHGDALYHFALLHLRDREEAEDCVQESLLAALQARSRFQEGSSVRTWLIGILKHKICDRFRRRRRQQADVDESAGARAVDAVFNERGIWARPLPRWTGVPEALVEREEFVDVLQACLGKLPVRTADAFCLREMHGLPTGRICEILEISPTNLWTILHRARTLLQGCLEGNWFGATRKGR